PPDAAELVLAGPLLLALLLPQPASATTAPTIVTMRNVTPDLNMFTLLDLRLAIAAARNPTLLRGRPKVRTGRLRVVGRADALSLLPMEYKRQARSAGHTLPAV